MYFGGIVEYWNNNEGGVVYRKMWFVFVINLLIMGYWDIKLKVLKVFRNNVV